jgi:hypothetical protein
MPEEVPDTEIQTLIEQAKTAGGQVEGKAGQLLRQYEAEALMYAYSFFRRHEKEAKINEARDRLRERLKALLGQ